YNYVNGVWYITRYPIRNYILEVGQSKRKGNLIAKTELAAETAGSTTNSSGSDIDTDYTDEIWSQVDQTLMELVTVGKLGGSSSSQGTGYGQGYVQGIGANGQLIMGDVSGTLFPGFQQNQQQMLQPQQQTQTLPTPNNGLLPPPTVEGVNADERIAASLSTGANTSNGNSFDITQPSSNSSLVTEETAEPWYKITASAGLITARAAPEAHRLIEEYLEQVQDSAHRQIVVEARIVAVIRDKQTNRGIQLNGKFDADGLALGSLGFTPASELDATNLVGGFLNLTASPNNTKDLTAIVQSLSTLGDVYTLSSPSVLARNNQMSRVSVTKQLGYVETEVETATGSNGDVNIGSRIDRANYKNAGTVMSVIPFIGKNGVQLRFRLSVATKSGDTTVKTSIGDAAPVENNVPNLANNVIDQDMMLEYGRVYAIGGLIETSTDIDESYEPTLSQIPGMKEVFRRANNQKQDTEFVVLVRVSRS
ncbi:MAG: hypothetical protein WAX89_06080, partial [Alphaproteobacteria bacterium]